jgi:hypothetical protein
MTRHLRPGLLAASLTLSALLGACATRAPEAPRQVTQADPNARPAADDREPVTGSRFPSRNTDRMVRQTGAAGAKEMERDRAPDPGPQSR